MTSYLVFRASTELGSPAAFQLVGEYEAHDPKGAVHAAVLALLEDGRPVAVAQVFAACASSSWQELTPQLKVETTVSFA